jgi:hypothetical protein
VITAVEASLTVLCAVVGLETLALKAILVEARRLDELYRSEDAPGDLLAKYIGVKLPTFSLPVLDSIYFVTERELVGRFTIVLFVTRADVTNLGRDVFLSLVRGLSSQSDECLYLVCECGVDDSRWIRDSSGVQELFGENVKILVDPEAELRKAVGISATPTGIAFDEDGNLLKVGSPVTERELSAA